MLPFAFDAVTVYHAPDCDTVGVPLIVQVVELILSPVGRVGLVEQLVIVQESVGVLGVIASPCV